MGLSGIPGRCSHLPEFSSSCPLNTHFSGCSLRVSVWGDSSSLWISCRKRQLLPTREVEPAGLLLSPPGGVNSPQLHPKAFMGRKLRLSDLSRVRPLRRSGAGRARSQSRVRTSPAAMLNTTGSMRVRFCLGERLGLFVPNGYYNRHCHVLFVHDSVVFVCGCASL